MGSISRRSWIQWPPEMPGEPTETIVLTSPQRRFVDIRILKTLPNLTPGEGMLPLAQLDWAFAGTSSSEWLTSPSTGQKTTHSRWQHWIDSRYPDAESVVDEADMLPTMNDKMLERGEMVNPATGQKAKYEEAWEEIPILGKDEVNGCVVLIMCNEAAKERGMVVRVGQYCQGVVREGELFSLERWAWTESGGWQRKARMGDAWMPCSVAMEKEVIVKGGKVSYHNQEWEVVELS